MAQLTQEQFRNFFVWFRNLSHQNAGVDALYRGMPADLLDSESEWIARFRNQVEDAPPASVVPPQCLDLIAEFEGFRAVPYMCPANKATIGFGSTFYEDGRAVQMSDSAITKPQARRMMEHIVEKDFWNVLKNTIPYWEDMNDNQKSALTSFGYNLGAHFFGNPGFNTITACLSDRAWDEVPGAFMLYVNPGSSFEAGLRRRRAAEGALWLA